MKICNCLGHLGIWIFGGRGYRVLMSSSRNKAFFHQIHLLLTQSQKFIGCIKGGPVPQFDTSDDLEEVAKLTGSSTHLMTSKKQRSSLPSGFARLEDTSDERTTLPPAVCNPSIPCINPPPLRQKTVTPRDRLLVGKQEYGGRSTAKILMKSYLLSFTHNPQTPTLCLTFP